MSSSLPLSRETPKRSRNPRHDPGIGVHVDRNQCSGWSGIRTLQSQRVPQRLGSLRLPHFPQTRRRNYLQTINQGVGSFTLSKRLAGALGDQVALDLGEQREEGGHDLGLDVALALDANVLLQRHEGDAHLGEGVEDGDALAANVCCAVETSNRQRFRGLTMEYGFWYFI